MSKEESEIDKTLGQARLLLIIGVIIIFLAPWIFTRNWYLPSFESTGPIGDTIGGITAPFLNLIGATLVFFALKAQVKANQLVQNQIKTDELDRNFRLVFEEIKILRKQLTDFIFTEYNSRSLEALQGGSPTKNYFGQQAISRYINSKLGSTDTKELASLLRGFNRILMMRDFLPVSNFQMIIINGDLKETFITYFNGMDDLIEKSQLETTHPLNDRMNEMREILKRLPVQTK
jgi:hypothetical protein